MSDSQSFPYETRLNLYYQPLEIVEEKQLADDCKFPWYNQTLCQVNDSVVRLGVMQGEFHWHKHDNEDEFFYVVSGKLVIDLKDRSVELLSQQGFTVPKGVVHRTKSPERTVMLMIEGETVIPMGD